MYLAEAKDVQLGENTRGLIRYGTRIAASPRGEMGGDTSPKVRGRGVLDGRYLGIDGKLLFPIHKLGVFVRQIIHVSSV